MSKDSTINIKKNDIVINPGDCFGWYSSVSTCCNPSNCLRSEWCKEYTIKESSNTKEESNMKKELEDLGVEDNINTNTPEEKAKKKKALEDIGKQVIFEKVVEAGASLITHDVIRYNKSKTNASLKIGKSVVAFFEKKKNYVYFEIGGRKSDGPTMKIDYENTNNTNIKDLIKPFVKQNYK